jgi:hypothetical protein
VYQVDFTFEKNRRLFLGTDVKVRFTVYDMEIATQRTQKQLEQAIAAGTAVPKDVTGWAFRFVVKTAATDDDDDALIVKTTAAGVVVVGTFDVDDPDAQYVEVTIEDTDSYDPSPVLVIDPGMYVHALKRTDDGSESIVAFGKWQFALAAARG